MAIPMTLPSGVNEFLDAAGWGGARITPLADDASFRRYFRVKAGARDAVLMDAPPPHEDPRPFIAVAEWLVREGFAAPRVFAKDLTLGLALIDDFGDVRMREAIDADARLETPLYRDVVDLLLELHQRPAMALATYDRATYHREVALFADWYCPALDLAVDTVGFMAAWDAVLSTVIDEPSPNVTVLRDYHAENIMLIDGETPVARLGLLDFQDALAGHAAYDLVSVLQDARRDVSPELEAEMLAYYQRHHPLSSRFEDCYHILGAQRNVKILGIFTRLWKRDNKPHYRAFQPRVWRYLEHDLAHPALAPVRAWFDANVPAAKRAAAWRQYVD